MVFVFREADPKDVQRTLQALTTTTQRGVAMATKTIPKTSDRKTQKEPTKAQKTRERIAEAFDGSILKLIDHGINGIAGDPYLSSLIEDEELEQDRQKFLALCYEITEAAKSLSDVQLTVIGSNLIRMEEMYYSRGCLGADKMAELLIRFYLQTHWNLSTARRFMTSKALTGVGDLDELGYAIEEIQAVYAELRKNTGREKLPVRRQVEEGGGRHDDSNERKRTQPRNAPGGTEGSTGNLVRRLRFQPNAEQT